MADLGFFLLFRGSLLGVAPAPCGTKVLQEWWASSTTKLVVLRRLFLSLELCFCVLCGQSPILFGALNVFDVINNIILVETMW